VSLYRTWRPSSFAELVGQDAVVRTLSGGLESGKIAHAYLFSGPRGSGKTSAAKIMARCLNCVNGPTATPDNTCDFCRAILEGTSLDVLEIDAASNRGIDEIRALRDAVKFAPAVMRNKVYIIDEAHMLTKEGANAFLKTLEEPPAHVVFILATTEPEKLPVTILSRCQRYAFRRITIPTMIERMHAIAAAEAIGIDDHALAAIAYRADGGLRDALTMLEQAAAFSDGTIDAATIDLAFGATGRQSARAILDAAIARDASTMLRAIEEAGDAGTDMVVLLRSLIAEFRNLLVARVDPELLARDLAPEDAAAAVQRARDVSQATLVRALRLLADAASLARSSGHARLELESALLRFVLVGEDPTLGALSARVAVLEGTEGLPAPQPVAPMPQIRPEPKPTVKSEPTVASGPPTLQKVRAAWQNVRGKVESERQNLRVPLSRAVVDSIDGNAIVLKLPAFGAEILRDNAAILEAAVLDVLGVPLKVVCKIEAGAAPAPSVRPTVVTDAVVENDDPDMLFQYASERIPEK
jgi:DNA polymerase-3 subunit gamma/tau